MYIHLHALTQLHTPPVRICICILMSLHAHVPIVCHIHSIIRAHACTSVYVVAHLFTFLHIFVYYCIMSIHNHWAVYKNVNALVVVMTHVQTKTLPCLKKSLVKNTKLLFLSTYSGMSMRFCMPAFWVSHFVPRLLRLSTFSWILCLSHRYSKGRQSPVATSFLICFLITMVFPRYWKLGGYLV